MTEEFEIQCERCGTIYSNLEEVCPYCGHPQPLFDDDILSENDYMDEELTVEEALYPDAEGLVFDEPYLDPVAAEYLSDESMLAGDETLVDDFSEEYLAAADAPLVTDDIFVMGDEGDYDPYKTYDEPYDYYQDDYSVYDEYSEYNEDETDSEAEVEPRRFGWGRSLLGCMGMLICIGLFYGSIGVLAAYHGVQEQVSATQAEAQLHYERGQTHLDNESYELAIAEFELAISLNPGFLEAREALRQAKRLAQNQPTPTSQTRSAAAASFLEEAETQLAAESWFEAIQTLAEVRDLDPDFKAEHVSELLYTANYQLGLQLTTPNRVDEALLSFERALTERPDDLLATAEWTKASFYIQGKTALENDLQEAVDAFQQLYQEDPKYLDIKTRLIEAYELLGDELAAEEDWCSAEIQYVEAALLQPKTPLQAKAEESRERCQETEETRTNNPSSPSPPPSASSARVTPTVAGSSSIEADRTTSVTPTLSTASVASEATEGGAILFSAFNPNESWWEILSVPSNGGAPKVLITDATMPAVSPNGQLLIYHSELIEAEGFHRFNLATGENSRITFRKRDILPRWGGDNDQFLFVAQEPGTGRWQVHLGFADGKSDPIILRDGRTPDWSPSDRMIAYQGTDPEGNNPGIYIVPFEGGEAIRLTTHESDRSPDFSPNGSQLAYMSTQTGNWDIYTISTEGGTPRQITTAIGSDGLPAWSPDGAQIAYVSDAGGSWAIYVIDAAGGTPRRVTAWDGVNRPDWLMAQIWWTQ